MRAKLFQHNWRVEQSAFQEILRNSPRSTVLRGCKFVVAILKPTAFTKIQVEASNVVNGTESWRKHNHQISKG